MTNPPPARPSLPPLELSPDLHSSYANFVRIAHQPSELVFDFASLLPGGPLPNVHTRLIMSPLGAKLFLRALADNLSRYEAVFGEIAIPGDSSLADHLFRGHPGSSAPPPAEPPPAGPEAPGES
jgi:hypothetical protein